MSLYNRTKSFFITATVLFKRGPSNVNRDRDGLPKGANCLGSERGRDSSQSRKRSIIRDALADSGVISVQTGHIGAYAYEKLIEKGMKKEKAEALAIKIKESFAKKSDEKKKVAKNNKNGKNGNNDDKFKTEVLKIQPCEFNAVNQLIEKLANGEDVSDWIIKEEKTELFNLYRRNVTSDISLFGRHASPPYLKYRVEAACRFGHAITVHQTRIRKDFFTAIDQLSDSKGAGHLGDIWLRDGALYAYSVIIDLGVLARNNDRSLDENIQDVCNLIKGMIECSPSGHSTTIANGLSFADYVLFTRGEGHYEDYSNVFVQELPIQGETPMFDRAVRKLRGRIEQIKRKKLMDVDTMELFIEESELDDSKHNIGNVNAFISEHIKKAFKGRKIGEDEEDRAFKEALIPVKKIRSSVPAKRGRPPKSSKVVKRGRGRPTTKRARARR